jgi:16S rRNA (cytosine967-C5)-methyltransferase
MSRKAALRVLVNCRTNGAWADAALNVQIRRDGLSGADAALCSRIVYGVLQNQLLLDHYISAYCSQKPDHLQPPLLDILRIGAYQILFLDKIPDSAAVNESVELAKIFKRGQAAGLVNAVLRKISKNKDNLPEIPGQNPERTLSIRYSHPRWLVKRLLPILGVEETEKFLAANNDVAPMTVQVNPLKTSAEKLTAELTEAGVTVNPHAWVPDCLELSGTGDLTALRAFRDGDFMVQDPAARLVSLIADVKPGQRVGGVRTGCKQHIKGRGK